MSKKISSAVKDLFSLKQYSLINGFWEKSLVEEETGICIFWRAVFGFLFCLGFEMSLGYG
jgi:hypothetical protein